MLVTGTYFHSSALSASLVGGHVFSVLFTSILSAPPDLKGINTAIESIVEAMKTVGRPVAILGVMLLALSWVAAGILPDWAKQNQGVLIKMLMGGVLLGIAGDVVSLVLPAAS